MLMSITRKMMGVNDAIVMDQKTFKSLASETRVKMLKLLAERRHTLSETATALGISLANASEHLEKLEDSNLIRQVDEGRKWKYYELTKDGKAIVSSGASPFPKSFVILLALSVVGLLGSLLLFSGMPGFDIGFGEQKSASPDGADLPMVAPAVQDAAPLQTKASDTASQSEGTGGASTGSAVTAVGAGTSGAVGAGVPTLTMPPQPLERNGTGADNLNASAGKNETGGAASVYSGANAPKVMDSAKVINPNQPKAGDDKTLYEVFALIFGAGIIYCGYQMLRIKKEKKLIE